MKKSTLYILSLVCLVLLFNAPSIYSAVSGEVLMNVQDSTEAGNLLNSKRVKDAGNIANDITEGLVASGLMVYDGTNWDKLTSTNGGISTISISNSLSLDDTADLIAVSTAQNSSDITCITSNQNALIKISYSANNVTADFRVALKDDGTTYTYSASVSPANTAIADSARFYGETIIVPIYGATAFQIRLDSVPTNSGNISAFGDCI